MNERIKKLRKALDLTQAEFANRLGMKQNSIALIESGRKTSDQTIRAICREFRVSEDWLRTGSGEMFLPPPRDALDELIEQRGLPREFRALTDKFLELKPDQQEAVIAYMRSVAAAFMAEATAAPVDQRAIWEAEARAEAERVYQEVLQEKRAEAGYSASPPEQDLLA